VAYNVVWLCPVPMGSIAGALAGEGARLTALHQIAHVRDWLDSAEADGPVDAVVVDASPAAQFAYEPAVMMEMLVDLLRDRPPRLLVVVVMHDPVFGRNLSHDALALEMHGMWPVRPRLVVQDAIRYLPPAAGAPPKLAKSNGQGQLQMWEDIAAKTGRMLGGSMEPDAFGCARRTRVLVTAMLAEPRADVPLRLGHTARRILVLLAYRRLDGQAIALRLSYTRSTVDTEIKLAAKRLREVAQDDWRVSSFNYYADLAERHSVWLRSLNGRHGLVLPGELPPD